MPGIIKNIKNHD